MQIYVFLASRKMNIDDVNHTTDLALLPRELANNLNFTNTEIPCSLVCEPAFKPIVDTNLPVNYNILKLNYSNFKRPNSLM